MNLSEKDDNLCGANTLGVGGDRFRRVQEQLILMSFNSGALNLCEWILAYMRLQRTIIIIDGILDASGLYH